MDVIISTEGHDTLITHNITNSTEFIYFQPSAVTDFDVNMSKQKSHNTMGLETLCDQTSSICLEVDVALSEKGWIVGVFSSVADSLGGKDATCAFLNSTRTGNSFVSALAKSDSFFAPVITTFPETKIKKTTLGLSRRYINPGKSSGS